MTSLEDNATCRHYPELLNMVSEYLSLVMTEAITIRDLADYPWQKGIGNRLGQATQSVQLALNMFLDQHDPCGVVRRPSGEKWEPAL